jgi:hypothetical protein
MFLYCLPIILQVQKQEQEIEFFFDSIKSKETRIKYSSYLKKYSEIIGIDNALLERDPD